MTKTRTTTKSCEWQRSYTIKSGPEKTYVDVCKLSDCSHKGYRLQGAHFRRKTVNIYTADTVQDWRND